MFVVIEMMLLRFQISYYQIFLEKQRKLIFIILKNALQLATVNMEEKNKRNKRKNMFKESQLEV
ncbi:hypothetical protein B1B04_23365 [Lysinibacillus sp. KCTC 33748]|nr:hypothetical protein B1B04_23365 [Lysinibacillus sp. KCTC 33748]